MTVHTYTVRTVWNGSTAGPYRAYDRTHEVTLTQTAADPAHPEAPSHAPAELDGNGAVTLVLSADPHFRGDARLPNPEQLLVAAASSCQLLSFLAVANHAGLDVVGYEDSADGRMDLGDAPARIAAITLRPIVHVAPGTDHAAVVAAVERAHEGCYIANSITAEITLGVTVVDAVPAGRS